MSFFNRVKQMMRQKEYLRNTQGFSLIELLTVLAIVGIMGAITAMTFRPFIARNKLRNCGSQMMANIQLVRSQAQSEGRRGVFQITNQAGAQDIDGDGINEYFFGYIDTDADGAYTAGESIVISGTNGDELCYNSVSVDGGTTVRNITFDPLGFVLRGAGNDIFLTSSTIAAVRLQVVSLTGMLRYSMNSVGCGTDGCDANDTWEEIQ